jgi:two-component system, NtrC family, response regulator AtoC
LKGIDVEPCEMKNNRILIADGDHSLVVYMRELLTRYGYKVFAADTGEKAIHLTRSAEPAVVFLDLHIPGKDGLETLQQVKKISEDVYVVMMSANGLARAVVTSMKLGAMDFLHKPFDQKELLATVGKQMDRRELIDEARHLREEIRRKTEFRRLFHHSERMKEVEAIVEQVADTDITVLIQGESGTGKEVVARALYQLSNRREKPFLKVNCAALPEPLLESEMFGYEKGAFTDATNRKPGKFELADGGTLFLDEISEMMPSLQAKLLQVLQDKQFSHLGGKEDIHVDVRVIAATNRNLVESVSGGTFREDLYYRLNVVNIQVASLRDRREEIPVLLEFFIKKYTEEFKKEEPSLSTELLEMFQRYPWPGNIRELENCIKRIVILNNDQSVCRELRSKCESATCGNGREGGLNEWMVRHPEKFPLKAFSKEAIRRAEREIIGRVLQDTCWNRKETAQRLQISYKALLYKIKETGLEK